MHTVQTVYIVYTYYAGILYGSMLFWTHPWPACVSAVDLGVMSNLEQQMTVSAKAAGMLDSKNDVH